VAAVKSYVVELPTADLDVGERVRSAAEALSREGTPVRFVRSVYVPEYEACRLVFEAPTPDAVALAGRRAGLVNPRIVEGGRT
jgi:hypothetical protein